MDVMVVRHGGLFAMSMVSLAEMSLCSMSAEEYDRYHFYYCYFCFTSLERCGLLAFARHIVEPIEF
jgi:hypothetical protein